MNKQGWLLLLLLCGCERITDFDRFTFGSDMAMQAHRDPPDMAMAPPPDMVVIRDLEKPLDMVHPLDLTPPPDLTPPVPRYQTDIQSDIEHLGCIASGCHLDTAQPLLTSMPTTQILWTTNYNNVVKYGISISCDMAAAGGCGEWSTLLTKNLAGDGVSHAVKPFASKNDPTYQKWFYWITSNFPAQ